MKCQELFSMKNLLQVLLGALRVKFGAPDYQASIFGSPTAFFGSLRLPDFP